jgi:hypothetical protein
MNLKPMGEQRKPSFAFTCKKCERHLMAGQQADQGREVYADLDGEPFKTYYCADCVEICHECGEPMVIVSMVYCCENHHLFERRVKTA